MCRQFLRELRLENFYETYKHMSKSPLQVVRYAGEEYLVYFAPICPSATLLTRLRFKQLDTNHHLVRGIRSKMQTSYLKYIFGGLLAASLAAAVYAHTRRPEEKEEPEDPDATETDDEYEGLVSPGSPGSPESPVSSFIRQPMSPRKSPVLFKHPELISCTLSDLQETVNNIYEEFENIQKQYDESKAKTTDTKVHTELGTVRNNRKREVVRSSKLPRYNWNELKKCLNDQGISQLERLRTAKLYEYLGPEHHYWGLLRSFKNTLSKKLNEAREIKLAENIDTVQRTGSLETKDEKPAPVEWKTDPIPVGIHNLGNSCYSNAVMQLLYTITPIREQACSSKTTGLIEFILKRMCQFARDGKRMVTWTDKSAHNQVLQLYSECNMDPLRQKDSMELLTKALDQSSHRARWMNILRSTLTTKLMCIEQDGRVTLKSKKDEPKFPVELNLRSSHNYSIQDAIDDYPTPTVISAEENVNALEGCFFPIRIQLLHNFGPYIIIQLKRFSKMGTKIETPILPNLELKLYSDRKYTLRGFIYHQGSLSEGHYMFFRRLVNGKWLKLNDDKVEGPLDNPVSVLNLGYIYLYSYKGPWEP